MALNVGEQAPDFSQPGNGEKTIRLADYRDRTLVLYFYPRDMTPGCTTEAIDFTALKSSFEKANAVVVGVSKDAPARHDKFITKHDLGIALVSDPEGDMLDDYGVWGEKKLYGRTFLGITRTTYLIDGEGMIRQVWSKVKVKGHAQAVLEEVEALATGA